MNEERMRGKQYRVMYTFRRHLSHEQLWRRYTFDACLIKWNPFTSTWAFAYASNRDKKRRRTDNKTKWVCIEFLLNCFYFVSRLWLDIAEKILFSFFWNFSVLFFVVCDENCNWNTVTERQMRRNNCDLIKRIRKRWPFDFDDKLFYVETFEVESGFAFIRHFFFIDN